MLWAVVSLVEKALNFAGEYSIAILLVLAVGFILVLLDLKGGL